MSEALSKIIVMFAMVLIFAALGAVALALWITSPWR